jgi:hypothetical protein
MKKAATSPVRNFCWRLGCSTLLILMMTPLVAGRLRAAGTPTPLEAFQGQPQALPPDSVAAAVESVRPRVYGGKFVQSAACLLNVAALEEPVLPHPPWLNLSNVLVAVGTLGAAVLVVLAWGVLLRRRIRQQTAVLREGLRRAAALKKQYHDLFENANDAILHNGVFDPGRHFLQKPFAPEALARKVREVLDAYRNRRP